MKLDLCNSYSTVLLVLVASAVSIIRPASAQQEEEESSPCTVCRDSEPVSLPDKPVEVPLLGIKSCAEVEQIVSSSLSANTAACDSIQDLGSLCGCSISESACHLCHDGSAVPFPNRLLGGLFVTDFLEAAPAVAGADPISCEVLEAVLHARDQSSSVCLATRQEFSELCGCPEPPQLAPSSSSSSVGQGEETANDPGDEDETNISDVAPQENRSPSPGGGCNVCKAGGDISLPDKQLDFDSFPVQDCNNLAIFARAFLSPESETCLGAQALGTYCGCPVPKEIRCTLCGNGERVKDPDRELDWFSTGEYSFLDVPEKFQDFAVYLTCGLLESILDSFDEESVSGVDVDAGCLAIQLRSSLCGCDPYWKELLLFWSYRVAGILSIMGSTYILYDVLFKRSRPVGTYHQIMVGISSFDMVSSLGYVLPLLPESSGFYGAKGNEGTCKLQGFMLQLGVASMFYNIALSLYYLLVVKYNWREFRFQLLHLRLHCLINVLGFGLALGAIPFYGHQLATCLVLFPPVGDSSIPTTFFFTIPLMLTLVITSAATAIVFYTVYRQEKRALKWKARKNLDMTKKVFWQCFLYACSFFITVPIRFATNYVEYNKKNHFWVAVVVAFVAPGQGLLNALVYRYRAMGSSLSCMCCRKVSTQPSTPQNSDTSPSMTEAGATEGDGPVVGAGGQIDVSSGPKEEVKTDETETHAIERADAESNCHEPNACPRARRMLRRTVKESILFGAAVEFWRSL